MSEINEEILNDADDLTDLGDADEDALLQDDEEKETKVAILNANDDDLVDMLEDEINNLEADEEKPQRKDKFATERQIITAPDSIEANNNVFVKRRQRFNQRNNQYNNQRHNNNRDMIPQIRPQNQRQQQFQKRPQFFNKQNYRHNSPRQNPEFGKVLNILNQGTNTNQNYYPEQNSQQFYPQQNQLQNENFVMSTPAVRESKTVLINPHFQGVVTVDNSMWPNPVHQHLQPATQPQYNQSQYIQNMGSAPYQECYNSQWNQPQRIVQQPFGQMGPPSQIESTAYQSQSFPQFQGAPTHGNQFSGPHMEQGPSLGHGYHGPQMAMPSGPYMGPPQGPEMGPPPMQPVMQGFQEMPQPYQNCPPPAQNNFWNGHQQYSENFPAACPQPPFQLVNQYQQPPQPLQQIPDRLVLAQPLPPGGPFQPSQQQDSDFPPAQNFHPFAKQKQNKYYESNHKRKDGGTNYNLQPKRKLTNSNFKKDSEEETIKPEVKIGHRPAVLHKIEDDDPQTHDLRKKIEEQRKKREEILKWKEENRRKQVLAKIKSVETPVDLPAKREINSNSASNPDTKIVEIRTGNKKVFGNNICLVNGGKITKFQRLAKEKLAITVENPPPNTENEPEADVQVDKKHLSSFLTGRKILAKDESLMDTRAVFIKNIASSTSDKKILTICKNIGQVQKLHRDKNERHATIVFVSVASAHAFFKRYQRHMLDLSMIEVSLKPLNEIKDIL